MQGNTKKREIISQAAFPLLFFPHEYIWVSLTGDVKSKDNFHPKTDIRMSQLCKALAGKIRQLTPGTGWKVEDLSGVGPP